MPANGITSMSAYEEIRTCANDIKADASEMAGIIRIYYDTVQRMSEIWKSAGASDVIEKFEGLRPEFYTYRSNVDSIADTSIASTKTAEETDAEAKAALASAFGASAHSNQTNVPQ